jgi:hypothetical protein
MSGFLNMSLRQILDAMELLHGIYTPSDILSMKSELAIPFTVGTFIEEHIAKQEQIYVLLAAAGQIEPELQKLQTFDQSLRQAKIFNRALEHFYLTNHLIANQTFANITLAMKNYYNSRPAESRSVEKAESRSVEKAEPKVPINSAAAVAYGGKKGAKPRNKFCWTHGTCTHSGMECNRRSPGHDETATFSDKKGSLQR